MKRKTKLKRSKNFNRFIKKSILVDIGSSRAYVQNSSYMTAKQVKKFIKFIPSTYFILIPRRMDEYPYINTSLKYKFIIIRMPILREISYPCKTFVGIVPSNLESNMKFLKYSLKIKNSLVSFMKKDKIIITGKNAFVERNKDYLSEENIVNFLNDLSSYLIPYDIHNTR